MSSSMTYFENGKPWYKVNYEFKNGTYKEKKTTIFNNHP